MNIFFVEKMQDKITF